MSQTLTGQFPVGFRRAPLSAWTQDLGGLIAWAKANDFSVLDIGNDGAEHAAEVTGAGLRLGSVDLLEWRGMLSPDAARRREAVAKNAAYVEACAAVGPVNHFVVMLPEDPATPPHEVFAAMVASYTDLAPVLEQAEAKIVIEGWPGPGALCCTTDSCRAFFATCPSPALGLNYDPSHLIRMGIDPLRFLREFSGRVFHVHAKDTELFEDERYVYGTEQRPLFGQTPAFGGPFWRYTLPGHGVMRWKKAFALLVETGYQGCVSVELEDAFFHGQQETEQAGLIAAKHFLASC